MTLKLFAYLPLLFVVVCLPMALRLVPPNGVYGIRTAETLASTAVWYTANFRAGVAGVVAGLAATIVDMIVLNSSTLNHAHKMGVSIGAMMATVLVIIVAGLSRS